MAVAAHQHGALPQAEPMYREVLRLVPRHHQALHLLGLLLHQRGEHEGALALIDRALGLQPEFPVALNNRGAVLCSLKRFDEALVSYNAALTLSPDYADALISRAAVLMQLRQGDAALRDCDKAIALAPSLAEAWNNRGILLQDRHRFEEAMQAYVESIRLAPGYADAHWNLARCCLLIGDYAQGWLEYEWRWRRRRFTSVPRNFSQPRWQGEALAGQALLLHAEQGLGDTLQCLRYVPMVVASGAQVWLEVQVELKPLVQNLTGVAGVLAYGESLPSFDLHCPLLSLPLIFRTTVDSVPPAQSLFVDEALQSDWASKLGPSVGLRVGVVWSGNPSQQDNDLRSLPLSDLVAAMPAGVELISLQKELRTDAERQIVASGRVRHFGDALRDFSDTAALLKEVDVVVSVCTSVAHLAGVMGAPLEVMLQYAHDWRWLLDRDDSPWYPTARLHRQVVQGDWQPVLAGVADAVRKRLA
ncbi:MAG: tetratricopeptide repeat-containing glycosyltransferase family protein [Rhodocyclaceae bacterium]